MANVEERLTSEATALESSPTMSGERAQAQWVHGEVDPQLKTIYASKLVVESKWAKGAGVQSSAAWK